MSTCHGGAALYNLLALYLSIQKDPEMMNDSIQREAVDMLCHMAETGDV